MRWWAWVAVVAAALSAGCADRRAAAPAATDTGTNGAPPATSIPPPKLWHPPRRPPQFVMISFDGSGDPVLWRHWRAVGQQTGARLSFFLSGVYLLDPADARLYHPPRHAPGSSDIGFSPSPAAVAALVRQIALGAAEGHEIGTHYNGHFCEPYPGNVQTWTAADWAHEIEQFRHLLAVAHVPVSSASVVGGRTPCLQGRMDVLYPVLRRLGLRYDTSQTSLPGVWPVRQYGIWSFPLALIPLVGTGLRSLSMDYNFFANQSAAQSGSPARARVYERQAYLSYLGYFNASYHGDRAPINIGNHFATWNHGAYVRALTQFVRTVCGKPEVRCVTYSTLVDWLDRLPPRALARYRAGRFPRT
jgi:peptidoglycan/xylan/chitin deacetylase (PgdA/CDA1 family)